MASRAYTAPQSPSAADGRSPAAVLVALLIGAFSFSLLHTMVAPALPAIAEAFGTTGPSAAWALSGYLLSAAVCAPLVGKLGDLHGRRRVLTAVLVVFGLGSVICALAGSIEVLIGGRVVQGVAGGVFALAFGIVNDTFPAERKAVAIGLLSATFGIGGGMGLPLAGAILDHGELAWLFLVGLIALPAAAAVWWVVPNDPPRGRATLDWGGAAVLSLGLVAVLLAISKASAWGWGAAPTVGLMLAGVGTLLAFAVLEGRVREPLVDMRMLGERSMLATNGASFFVGVAMFGSFILIPQYSHVAVDGGHGLGLSMVGAGLVMLPSAVAMLVCGPVAGALANRYGGRAVLALGALLVAVAFGSLAAAHDGVGDVVFAGVLIGGGISFAWTSMANLIVAGVDARDIGIATGLNTVARAVGGAFSAALVATLLAAATVEGTATPAESAYVAAFLVMAAAGLVAAGFALAIPRIPALEAGIEESTAPASWPA
ncbi:MAG TPA: MFS transporter [Thermoleophilaceae bacterium]|nr:MFS transporter [Thermoleophilaceae bacterium]